jgi:hypothetical protein
VFSAQDDHAPTTPAGVLFLPSTTRAKGRPYTPQCNRRARCLPTRNVCSQHIPCTNSGVRITGSAGRQPQALAPLPVLRPNVFVLGRQRTVCLCARCPIRRRVAKRPQVLCDARPVGNAAPGHGITRQRAAPLGPTGKKRPLLVHVLAAPNAPRCSLTKTAPSPACSSELVALRCCCHLSERFGDSLFHGERPPGRERRPPLRLAEG